MKTAILFAAGLSLFGCMNSPNGTLAGVEYTCAAGTAAIRTVTLFNAKLTPVNRDAVTKAIAVLNPVCSQPNLPTIDSTAQAALTGALTQLTVAATQVSAP